MKDITKDTCDITDMAVAYSFYPKNIILEIVKIIVSNCKLTNYILREWGFMIYSRNTIKGATNVFIRFIFIKPEYRRKGIFTKLINTLKGFNDIITYTSNERSMLKFAEKNNFNTIAVCRDERDIYYGWSDKYDEDYIYDVYY